MRNCTTPFRDSLADYDGCVRRSRGPKRLSLTARRGQVAADYAAYIPGEGRAHLVPRSDTWSDEEKNWQRDLYELTYEGNPLEEIRAVAFEFADNRCLLCSVGGVGQLDHFLPKESYPALSLYSLNLIGACEPCNHTKLSLANADPLQQFVHPYFDLLPLDDEYLVCEPFNGMALSPKYTIVACAGVDLDLTARMRWQFETLELDKLYSDEAVKLFRESRHGWRELAEKGGNALLEDIQRALRSATAEYGRNRLKPALLQGLLNDVDFMATPLEFLHWNR
jgi:5-methylcytosine-specific restriction endonuclease McrA